MTRGRKWNVLAVLMLVHLLVALIDVATTYDIDRTTQEANGNIRNGNKKLLEEEINESATKLKDDDLIAVSKPAEKNVYKVRPGSVLDVNEIPVRFDEAQLWRIYNISNNMRRQMMPEAVADVLENKYGE